MSDVNEELGRTEEQEKEMVGEIAENSGEQGINIRNCEKYCLQQLFRLP